MFLFRCLVVVTVVTGVGQRLRLRGERLLQAGLDPERIPDNVLPLGVHLVTLSPVDNTIVLVWW